MDILVIFLKFYFVDKVKSTSIKNAIASFNKFTCIRYEEGDGKEGDYVHFKINKTM